MNLALWIVQALLAAAFFAAGLIKLFRPKEKIAANPRLGWANDFTASQIKLIGLAEVLGAPGLVLPLYLPPSRGDSGRCRRAGSEFHKAYAARAWTWDPMSKCRGACRRLPADETYAAARHS